MRRKNLFYFHRCFSFEVLSVDLFNGGLWNARWQQTYQVNLIVYVVLSMPTMDLTVRAGVNFQMIKTGMLASTLLI